MNNTQKQIIIILAISTVLGLLRFFMLDDPEFTLIKQIRVLEEVDSFDIPDIMTEPMMVDLTFTKHYFDKGDAVIVDAREEAEFDVAHIKDAVNIPFDYYDEYLDIIDAMDYSVITIVYCSGGECSLSLDLADIFLSEKGFESVFIFEGGLPAWEDAGYPVE